MNIEAAVAAFWREAERQGEEPTAWAPYVDRAGGVIDGELDVEKIVRAVLSSQEPS